MKAKLNDTLKKLTLVGAASAAALVLTGSASSAQTDEGEDVWATVDAASLVSDVGGVDAWCVADAGSLGLTEPVERCG